MSPKKIVVDTDVILEYLVSRPPGARSRSASVLRRVMSMFFCYTTVFNAIQLFALCRSSGETEAVEGSLSTMKVLGLNGKTSKNVGLLMRYARRPHPDAFDLLIAGLCVESKLPILTGRPERFRSVRSLLVVPSGLVTQHATAEAVLREAA